MSKPAAPRDGVTVVIPAHNAAAALDRVLPAWGAVLTNTGRPFEILVVNDGSTDGTAAALDKLAARVPHLRTLTHDKFRGFGACLRTALAEAKHPLFMYAGVDYPYTPADIKPMLERIDLRDEILGKQPDLISGARAGQPRPLTVKYLGGAWKLFWRVFAGLPIVESPPWYGWGESWYRARVGWVFGVPLADVNSAFKLYRTAFLKRFPIQSDGDFVHTELVAKATFLTSIMDEVPITPRPEPPPPLGPIAADKRKVFRAPEFSFYAEASPSPPVPEVAPVAPTPAPVPPALGQGATAPANLTPTATHEARPVVPSSPAPTAIAEATKTSASPPSVEVATKGPTDTPSAPPHSQPASEQPKPVSQPLQAAQAAPSKPVPEPVQPAKAADQTHAQHTEPDASKAVPDSTPASSPAPSGHSKPDAGGLASPGSPVPAT